MSDPIFSIITVTKNNAAGLRLTGKSLVLQQDVPRFEWIVVDGASTDGTLEVMAEFSADNVQVVSEPDDGIFHAMNKGLDRAQGRYIWFMNAGDCLAHSFILREIAREIQGALGPDFLYGDAREAGRVKAAKPFSHLIRGQITHHQAMLYRRDIIKEMRFDTRYQIAADYDFTLRFIDHANRQHYMKQVLCDFAPGGISQQQAETGRLENYAIRRDVLGMGKLRNGWRLKTDQWAFRLKQNYPWLYWRLRTFSR